MVHQKENQRGLVLCTNIVGAQFHGAGSRRVEEGSQQSLDRQQSLNKLLQHGRRKKHASSDPRAKPRGISS